MMDPLKASIVQAWDRGVADYDDLVAHGRLTRTEADAWKAALAQYLPPAPAQVLEVGAGTGAMSLLIAELGYPLTAIDISRRMLQEARRKAAQRGLTITFEIADAEVLPFATAPSTPSSAGTSSGRYRIPSARWPSGVACCGRPDVSSSSTASPRRARSGGGCSGW